MKILIASEASDVRKALGKILQAQEHECIFVEKCGGVIDRVYQELPEVIVLDTQCTGKGGLYLLELLKSAPSTRDIPVLLSLPTRRLKDLAKGYGLGAFDYIFRPYLAEEILAKIDHISIVAERLRGIESQLQHDALTGLFNRRFFMERFGEELDWASRYQEPLSLMILDIDHFKKVNDTFGHLSGDDVLRQVAQTTVDTVGSDGIAGRFGGEEFVVLLPNHILEEAEALAERIRSAVQNRRFVCVGNDTASSLSITVSLGVTGFSSEPGSTIDSMVALADDALYAAKEGGRNRVVLRDPSAPVLASE